MLGPQAVGRRPKASRYVPDGGACTNISASRYNSYLAGIVGTTIIATSSSNSINTSCSNNIKISFSWVEIICGVNGVDTN